MIVLFPHAYLLLPERVFSDDERSHSLLYQKVDDGLAGGVEIVIHPPVALICKALHLFGDAVTLCFGQAQCECFHALVVPLIDGLERDTATTLHDLAHLYEEQGYYEQAEAYHQRELSIREKTLGLEHPATAQSLFCMANLSKKQGQYEQAETFLQRALAIREKALSPEHPDIIKTLKSYASLLRVMDRPGEALSLEQRVRAIRAKQQSS